MAVLSTIILAPSKYRLSFRSWPQKPVENLPACPFIIFIQRVPSTAVEDSTWNTLANANGKQIPRTRRDFEKNKACNSGLLIRCIICPDRYQTNLRTGKLNSGWLNQPPTKQYHAFIGIPAFHLALHQSERFNGVLAYLVFLAHAVRADMGGRLCPLIPKDLF